jgi:large subunit ribosomal protein L22
MKRIRPAPMGRAFRVVKRTAHLTVRVSERPLEIAPVASPATKGRAAKTKAAVKTAPAAKAPARKRATPAKKVKTTASKEKGKRKKE